MKKTLNNNGFGLIGVLAIILVLVVAGGAGAYVYHRDHKAKGSTTSSTGSTGTTTKPPTPADPYAGWKTYTLPVEKLSFKYPSDWTVSNAAPTSTQDATTLTSSDGFTVNIEDGVSNGGDTTPEAPAGSAVPVTFVGQSDYLVFTYGTGSVGQGSSNGLIAGTALQTNTNEHGGPGRWASLAYR
jgi:hypothetical protein